MSPESILTFFTTLGLQAHVTKDLLDFPSFHIKIEDTDLFISYLNPPDKELKTVASQAVFSVLARKKGVQREYNLKWEPLKNHVRRLVSKANQLRSDLE